MSIVCVSCQTTPPLSIFSNLCCAGDVNEMEAHAEEISADKLNQLAFLNARLSPEGHAWGSK